MSKKFVNKVEEAVDDALFGLVSSNSGVKFHERCPRVVHLVNLDSSKVSLIAGGGSGHEPYASGYVGQGLLTAAVAGNLFASPPSRNVLAALEVTKSTGGALVFVINYTGDRLNFGLAAERFNATNGNAKVITIADDVAIDNPNNTVGRRGLAGAVLTIKIAGAMSDKLKSIDEIYEVSQKVVNSIGTLGVSLYSGSLPGKSCLTELPEDQIEVGLGIHGEPGKFRTQYESAQKIINNLMNKLSAKMELREGEKLVVLVNNLGSVSQLEMGIINGEVLRWLDKEKINVTRFFSGTYMTSLDGHGISVTILRADDSMIQYLDAPAKAPGWIPALSPNKIRLDHFSKSSKISQITNIPVSGVTMNAQIVEKCLDGVVKAMIDSEKHLNQLDAYAGDGDCGSTFSGAARAIKCSQEQNALNLTHPQTLLKQLSIIFEQNVGGTSGALYALMFSSAAKCFEEKIDKNSVLEALNNANLVVQKYGGARVGDRTMVDSLDAMVEVLKNENFEKAVKASEKAAENTAYQIAAVGRASYTSSDAQTKPDAGATAISYWLRACWSAYQDKEENK